MYFPSDMNFQYFFFDTYPGYFLQALPVALIAGGIYAACQIRRNRRRSPCKIVLSALFVCYITGLLCLTLFNSLIGDIYYFLFYHAPSGRTTPGSPLNMTLSPTSSTTSERRTWAIS